MNTANDKTITSAGDLPPQIKSNARTVIAVYTHQRKRSEHTHTHTASAYRKLAGDRIEAHVHRVLEIGRIRNVGLRVAVRRFRALDLALQRLLLAIGILGLCNGQRR